MRSFNHKSISHKLTYLIFTIFASILLVACSGENIESESSATIESTEIEESTVIEESKEPTSESLTVETQEESTVQKETETAEVETESAAVKKEQKEEKTQESSIVTAFKVSDIPEFAGRLYVDVNKNVPYFTDAELQAAFTSYEQYANLDSLGRCGTCVASVGQDIMPTEERGKIGEVKPTGWKQNKYAGLVDGNYLYNRCHLIGYQLTGENANTKNLITGTRCFNTEGMLPFENMVADYVKETNKHVLYRVTPIFQGSNLLADGVLMEGKSVEDNGAGILFCVFVYNVQPGIKIDYATGENELASGEAVEEKQEQQPAEKTVAPAPENKEEPQQATPETAAYAVNQRNGKIHIVGKCPATGTGGNAMKHPVYFNTYEEAEAYSIQIAPNQQKRKCGNCW